MLRAHDETAAGRGELLDRLDDNLLKGSRSCPCQIGMAVAATCAGQETGMKNGKQCARGREIVEGLLSSFRRVDQG